LTSIGASAAADATIIVEHYSLSATTGGPFTSHSGTFTLSHNKDTPLFRNLDKFDLTIGPLVFNEDNVFFTSEFSGNREWFWRTAGLDILSTNGRTASFGYLLDGQFYSGSATFTLIKSLEVNPDVGAVPEPATWAMFILGFGMVGGAMRQRGRANVRISFA
jgi:hypothetical protein